MVWGLFALGAEDEFPGGGQGNESVGGEVSWDGFSHDRTAQRPLLETACQSG